MSQFVELGPEAKVRINQAIFAVIEGRYRLTAEIVDASDSEAVRIKKTKPGMRQLEADLTAQRADDVPPHIAPLLLLPGEVVSLDIYPSGLLDDPYSCSFRIADIEGTFRVANSEPQTLRISGASTDVYSLPND